MEDNSTKPSDSGSKAAKAGTVKAQGAEPLTPKSISKAVGNLSIAANAGAGKGEGRAVGGAAG